MKVVTVGDLRRAIDRANLADDAEVALLLIGMPGVGERPWERALAKVSTSLEAMRASGENALALRIELRTA